MQEQGEWNPPTVPYDVSRAVNIFRHLDRRRSLISIGMADVVHPYISEDEIYKYFLNNEITENKQMLIRIIYAVDELTVKHLNKKRKNKTKKK